ncbi:MAG: hypothetical protein K5858_08125, partial [Lachnospiraceae bacterium]|nr:hypothetical protein [Lachnospiraceae bacterium]
ISLAFLARFLSEFFVSLSESSSPASFFISLVAALRMFLDEAFLTSLSDLYQKYIVISSADIILFNLFSL